MCHSILTKSLAQWICELKLLYEILESLAALFHLVIIDIYHQDWFEALLTC